MISLSDDDVSALNDRGYVLLKQPFGPSARNELEKIASLVERRIKASRWPYVRVYHPKVWCNDVAGIEAPFNEAIHEEGIEKYFREIDFSEIAEKVGWANAVMPLMRVHRSPKYIKYAGNWHQDMVPNQSMNNGLQIVLYLRDEKGFRVVPEERTDEVIARFPNGSWQDWVKETGSSIPATLPSEFFDSVEAKAGDIFIFKSGLFHQGVEFGGRFHYHMRIIPLDLYSEKNDPDELVTLDFMNVKVAPEYKVDADSDILKERLPESPGQSQVLKFFSDLISSINYLVPVRNFFLRIRTRDVDRRLAAEGRGVRVWRYSNTIWQKSVDG